MFDTESRYYNVETVKVSAAVTGTREIAYKKRRFLPRGEKMQLLTESEIGQDDRLDQVLTRTLGNPEQFWRVADANNAMNPFSLTENPGRRIRIPVPDARFS